MTTGVILSALVAITACRGTKPHSTPRPRALDSEYGHSLAERSQSCWEARAQENWTAVFDFIDPNIRENWSRAEFAGWSTDHEPFVVLGFDILSVEEAAGLGWVTVRYESRLRQFPDTTPRTAEMIEKWWLSNGTWHLVPREMAPSIPAPPSSRDANAESRLRRRSDAAWRARVNDDHASLYAFLDPLQKRNIDLDLFAKGESLIDYLDRTVQWVEVVDGQGRICVTYEFKLADPNLEKMQPTKKTIIEQWKLRDGDWHYVRE